MNNSDTDRHQVKFQKRLPNNIEVRSTIVCIAFFPRIIRMSVFSLEQYISKHTVIIKDPREQNDPNED